MPTFKHRIIAQMQYELGKRVGDILRLKKDCFQTDSTNPDEPLLVINFITKGDKRHTMWVYNPQLSADIQRFVAAAQGGERVFVDETISDEGASAYTMMRTNYKRYWIDLKQSLRDNGVAFKDWATHDWRRAYARRVWDKYKDLNVLKEALGHSDVGSTIRYLRSSGLTNKDVLRGLSDDKSRT
jgi:integrase